MISPVEIRQQTFGRALRGFDVEEVRSFLKSLSMEWEDILTENRRLKIELESTRQSLNSFKELEAILHKTLLQAEQSTKIAMANAEREAAEKIAEAETRAAQMLGDIGKNRAALQEEIDALLNVKKELTMDLKHFLRQQLARIAYYETENLAEPSQEQDSFNAAFYTETPPLPTSARKLETVIEAPVLNIVAKENTANVVTEPLVRRSVEPNFEPEKRSIPVVKSVEPPVSPIPPARDFIFPAKEKDAKQEEFLMRGEVSFFDAVLSNQNGTGRDFDLVGEL